MTGRLLAIRVARWDVSISTVVLGGSIVFTSSSLSGRCMSQSAGGGLAATLGPLPITVGPNGDAWFTMSSATKIATLQLR